MHTKTLLQLHGIALGVLSALSSFATPVRYEVPPSDVQAIPINDWSRSAWLFSTFQTGAGQAMRSSGKPPRPPQNIVEDQALYESFFGANNAHSYGADGFYHQFDNLGSEGVSEGVGQTFFVAYDDIGPGGQITNIEFVGGTSGGSGRLILRLFSGVDRQTPPSPSNLIAELAIRVTTPGLQWIRVNNLAGLNLNPGGKIGFSVAKEDNGQSYQGLWAFNGRIGAGRVWQSVNGFDPSGASVFSGRSLAVSPPAVNMTWRLIGTPPFQNWGRLEGRITLSDLVPPFIANGQVFPKGSFVEIKAFEQSSQTLVKQIKVNVAYAPLDFYDDKLANNSRPDDPADHGYYRLDLPAGNYNLVFKGAHWLSKTFHRTVTMGNIAALDVTLDQNGDVNNDNTVDDFDLFALTQDFLSTPTAQTDLNEDGFVDDFDLFILTTNFLLSGS